MPIGPAVADIWRFFRLFKMAAIGHLGFVIRVWTTHEEHLVAFVNVQNLSGFDVVVLTVCKF